MERVTRVAALYDIHGNLAALDAVLGEVDRLGIERVVIGGDVVWGPQPAQTLDRLYRLGPRARWVRGNADREVADRLGLDAGLPPELVAITLWCADQLSGAQRAFLATLPEQQSMEIDGLGAVRFCHGSPRRDDKGFTLETSDAEAAPMLARVREGVVVCGHTHAPFDRHLSGKRVVNAGSVGLQYGNGASWAILGPNVELRRTAYDVEGAAAAIMASNVPDCEGFAAHIRTPPPMPGEPLPPLHSLRD